MASSASRGVMASGRSASITSPSPKLGASYPRMMPELGWKSPVFHPNISAGGVVCLGGYGTYWTPSLNLDELCGMLWDMIRYENYDPNSPYNREAAHWVRTQRQFRLPIDDRPIRDRLAAKGYVNQLQLEADKFAVEKSRKELDAAKTKLKVLDEYTKAKMLKQLESDIAIAKAYTAAGARRGTHEYNKLAVPGSPTFGIHTTNQGRFTIIGGGLPVVVDGQVVGGIGVSTGTAEEDQVVAQAGIDHFLARLAGGRGAA